MSLRPFAINLAALLLPASAWWMAQTDGWRSLRQLADRAVAPGPAARPAAILRGQAVERAVQA